MLHWEFGRSLFPLLGFTLSVPVGRSVSTLRVWVHLQWKIWFQGRRGCLAPASQLQALSARHKMPTTERDPHSLHPVLKLWVKLAPCWTKCRREIGDCKLMVLSEELLLMNSLSFPTALRCNCTNCEKTGYECETDGACMASTYYIQGKEQHVRICINRDNLVPPGQPFYCLSAEGLLNTHCCYEDYCNSIDLKVPGEAPSSNNKALLI